MHYGTFHEVDDVFRRLEAQHHHGEESQQDLLTLHNVSSLTPDGLIPVAHEVYPRGPVKISRGEGNVIVKMMQYMLDGEAHELWAFIKYEQNFQGFAMLIVDGLAARRDDPAQVAYAWCMGNMIIAPGSNALTLGLLSGTLPLPGTEAFRPGEDNFYAYLAMPRRRYFT